MVVRGRVVTPEAVLDDAVVVTRDGVITEVCPTAEWAGRASAERVPVPEPDGIVLPGLVDIHAHGGGGHSLASTDAAEVRAAAGHHHQSGTASVVASLVTASPEEMLAQAAALAPLVACGAVAGIHAEGPFLSRDRCGAQDPRFLQAPDAGFVQEMVRAAEGTLRMMTVAPELPGAAAAIDVLRESGVRIALGHTDASYDVFRQHARDLDGTALVTHLANGMPPMHHRDPGPVAAALLEAAADRASVELIADGVHLDDGFVQMVFGVAAAGRVVLVTDAMAAAGMADGNYRLGSLAVQVTDGVARLSEGAAAGSIAGGTASLLHVVRRVVHSGAAGLRDAVNAASRTPARLLGIDDRVGAVTPGRTADLLVVDDDLELVSVLRAGR